jgi:hypothetical protein
MSTRFVTMALAVVDERTVLGTSCMLHEEHVTAVRTL